MNKSMWFFLLLWPIILLPKSLQLLLLLGLGVMLAAFKIKNANKIFILICMYSGVHLVSIVVNSLIGDYELSRIAAAVNTAVIWIGAALLYEYYRTTKMDVQAFLKICFWNENVMLLLLLLYLFLAYVRKIESFTMPVINTIFYGYDWPLYRFWGLMEYPTLIGGFSLLTVPFACLYIWMKTKKFVGVILYYVCSFLPVYFAFSRNGYVLYFAIFCVCILAVFVHTFQKHEAYTVCLISAGVGIACVPVILSFFSGILDKLLSMREGSGSARGEIYAASLQAFYESPLLGKGIKGLNEMFLPLGSHCSYIGYLYKTGILGTICIMIVFICIAMKVWKNNKGIYHRLMCIFLYGVLAYCIFEDLDGANWLVCLFFAVAGILENKENSWKRGEGK